MKPANQHSTDRNNTINLFQELKTPGKRWFWLFLAMVAGALAGFGIHHLMPPMFVSSAAVTFSIDFVRTGEMTDVETDIAIVTVGDILSSSSVIDNTLKKGVSAGLPGDGFIFDETAFLERYSYRYELVVENANPEIAAKWADLWAVEGLAILKEAKLHALNADSLYRQMLAAQACLQQSGLIEPVAAGCQGLSISELDTKLSEYNQAYLEEKELSLGFLPAMDYSLTKEAEPAVKPERRMAGILVLGGALLGAAIFSGFILIGCRRQRG